MLTKKEKKLLTEVLDLEGLQVVSKQQHEGIGIILGVESLEKKSTCDRCGVISDKLHQNHKQIIKDLAWGEQAVFLEINRRQFKCDRCNKPFSEKFNFVTSRRKYTKRLATKTIEEVLGDDIYSIAKKGTVTTKEIDRMLKADSIALRFPQRALHQADASVDLLTSKPIGLKRLRVGSPDTIGIDEIALIKGQGNYCAVLVDLDSSKLLMILEGRTKEEIGKVLSGWGIEILEKIEEVSIDLWKGYKSLVKEMLPNAQIVADRFHVMAQINKELDEERKKEKRAIEQKIKQSKSEEETIENKKILAGIVDSKYALLKNEDDLNEEQKEKLAEVKIVSERLGVMHQLKEEFREIFEETEIWADGLLELGGWLSKAQKYFTTSQGTIYRWFDEILAYFNNATTSGVVEGINTKIKLIKRADYGFRNFKNFQNRCLLSWHF
jgi:transposase